MSERAAGEVVIKYERAVLDRMAWHVWDMFAERLQPGRVPPPDVDAAIWREEMGKLASMVCDSIAQSLPTPPGELSAAAISAAEAAYWADFGVSRHNMEAAIRAYLAVVRS